MLGEGAGLCLLRQQLDSVQITPVLEPLDQPQLDAVQIRPLEYPRAGHIPPVDVGSAGDGKAGAVNAEGAVRAVLRRGALERVEGDGVAVRIRLVSKRALDTRHTR